VISGTTGFFRLACVVIVLAGLGAGPLFAQPAPPPSPDTYARLAEFQTRLDELARALANEPGLNRLSPQQRQATVEFVVGNMLFVAAHELGHAVISELDLPVLGREEDAADDFAILAALRIVVNKFSEGVLVGASKGWFLSAQRDRKEGEPPTYYERHGLSEQRAYQIVCLMVGADALKFKALADELKLPEDRRRSCGWDYDTATRSWRKVIAPHIRAADQPRTQIQVIYGDAAGKLELFARSLRALRFLEVFAEYASERYVWPAPIVMEMRSCGQVGARWTIPTRTLHICYEMAKDFADLYRDYGPHRSAFRPKPKAKRRS
jgi:Putative metallopeptidase